MNNILCFDGNKAQGVWWMRLFGVGISLKAPWNVPLFSERYGYRKTLFKFRGWRVLGLKREVVQ